MNTENLKFEQSITRLEEIVKHLEKGDTSLEDAIKLFEEGTQLSANCAKILNNAEQKVTRLIKSADGSPIEEPME